MSSVETSEKLALIDYGDGENDYSDGNPRPFIAGILIKSL